jgi:hypothetical protein
VAWRAAAATVRDPARQRGCASCHSGWLPPKMTVIIVRQNARDTGSVRAWEKYQHDTAHLLRELGFTTKVNDPLQGPNSVVHRVDVSARITVAGVAVLWIVECKLWNSRVPKEKVSALKDIVNDLAADRGLLMSEEWFQSGAIKLAAAKNITLSSLEDLRSNAAEQLITSRVTRAELRLLRLIHRVTRDLRTFGPAVSHLLPALAERATEADRAEFARRPDAADFRAAVKELATRIGDATVRSLAPSGLDASAMSRTWRNGVSAADGDQTAVAIQHLAQALNQGRLDDWPVVIKAPDDPKLAWSMPQLLGVVEPGLKELEERVDAHEASIKGRP